VANPKIFEKGEGGGEAEDDLSAPSSFIANAHNEIYAFYAEKKRLFGERKLSRWERGPPPLQPL